MSTGREEAVWRWLTRRRAAGSPCWRRSDGQGIRRGEAWRCGATSSPTRGTEVRRKDYTTFFWSMSVGRRECGVTAALCVVCLLYIWIKPVEGRVLVISARLRERPGLSRSLPAHQLLGIFREGLADVHVGPLSLLSTGWNTLWCIVRRPGRGAATWVSRKRSDPTDWGPQRL